MLNCNAVCNRVTDEGNSIRVGSRCKVGINRAQIHNTSRVNSCGHWWLCDFFRINFDICIEVATNRVKVIELATECLPFGQNCFENVNVRRAVYGIIYKWNCSIINFNLDRCIIVGILEGDFYTMPLRRVVKIGICSIANWCNYENSLWLWHSWCWDYDIKRRFGDNGEILCIRE